MVKHVGGPTQENNAATDKDSEQFGPPGKNQKRIIVDPKDVVLASTTLALALSQGRSPCEIETLINLFALTKDNLQAILAQILINEKAPLEFIEPL